MLFPRVALLTILLCLGLGALFLLVIWRSRTRGGSSPGQLPLKVAAAPRKQDRPPS
jgi:hypothetical protein